MSLHLAMNGSTLGVPDTWSGADRPDFDAATFAALERGPLPDLNDLVVTISLAQLLRAEYMAPDAELGRALPVDQVAAAHRALAASAARHGLTLDLPWHDLPTFEAYRLAHGHQGWTGRRALVAEFFGPLMDQLQTLENERFINALRRAASNAG
ncbi:hypothetical protein [Enemella evansiae]|uniref:hypothetical protein n=1 Tax=Enemella evansiae TaxID=2016499 RepID=UPI000B962D1C|nr:hypothetical protein [Enemella evansiae]OYO12364.1 hypothetical protein BI335_14205 [Enemella evansiae]TDO93253.1 hypothetical protein C8D81_1033 [Enemella evansiae]